jgi:exo-1,4-beta-D-glucosaminidase
MYFVQLTLDDDTGKRLSTNFYWLSKKSETLDWSKVTYDTTEALAKAQYGDFLGLNSLPRVRLKHSTRTEHRGSEMLTHVLVENPDKSLAMFVHLAVKRSNDSKGIPPVLWQDNYISLLPGEKREITAEYRESDLQNSKPLVSVDGWNVAE